VRSMSDMMAAETIARIRRKWPPNHEARMRRVMAALKSGYLKIGRLYCGSCARQIEQQFELLDGDYDPMWFAAVSVPIEKLIPVLIQHDLHLQDTIGHVQAEARRLHGDRAQAKTVNAWLLVNRRLWRKLAPPDYEHYDVLTLGTVPSDEE